MPLPKIEDARNMSNDELADAILSAKRELFDLRLQQATRRLEKPHQFKHVRHRIAQMMTVVHERELAAAKSASETSKPSAASVPANPTASQGAADASQPDQEEE